MKRLFGLCPSLSVLRKTSSSTINRMTLRNFLKRNFSFSASLGVASQHRLLLSQILRKLENGSLSANDAEKRILQSIDTKTTKTPNEKILESFANLDHNRPIRTGFPEVIFAAGKTPQQIATILDDMAGHVNQLITNKYRDNSIKISTSQKAILATRVDPKLFQEVSNISLTNGQITYHQMANIISMKASALIKEEDTIAANENNNKISGSVTAGHIVVACAGTTDLSVAEEAAVTLEAAGCVVDRIYDVGVAGLHRIIHALPRLRHDDVDSIIVCAGMDGALPSVVGGLVDVPVIAVPTSVGYGASLGGMSAMLTMLNSCAPGVGVVNIDNGFGGAALAFKCIQKTRQNK